MKIKANFDLLAEKAREKFPDLRLFLGSELYCEPGRVIQWVEDGQALSMNNTDYLLLEFLEYGGATSAPGTSATVCWTLLPGPGGSPSWRTPSATLTFMGRSASSGNWRR